MADPLMQMLMQSINQSPYNNNGSVQTQVSPRMAPPDIAAALRGTSQNMTPVNFDPGAVDPMTLGQDQPQSLDPASLSGKIQEWLGATPPRQGGLVENILRGRSKPTLNDWADSVAQTATTGKPVSPNEFSDQRLSTALKALETMQQAEFERQKFTESQRHNLATEGLAGQRIQATMYNQSGAGKPIPAAALKLQNEDLDAIGTASGLNADLGNALNAIQSGTLELGPVKNIESGIRNWAGLSSPNSRNYNTFISNLEKMRNDSLRLNKGVQTEGDSKRAWDELIRDINDPKVVAQRLQEIIDLNERAVLLRQNNVDLLRQNYGKEPLDYTEYTKQSGAILKDAQTPNNDADLLEFMTPEERALFE